MSPRDHSSDILLKNVVALRTSPTVLPRAKLKSYGLTAFRDGICRQPSIDFVALLLVPHLCRSILKRTKLSKEKYNM